MRSISTRFTGLLLVALGVWGGLVPFVGHYFHFALGPDKAWSWTMGRLYLSILPAVATVLGGLNLMSAGPRRSARLGALLALAGGIWFTIGPEISQLWHAGGAQGAGHGSAHIQMLEMLTYHTGLGVVIAALAAYALPRFPVLDEAVAGRRARATGAGAAAGGVAGRDERWYHEPGALDAPESRRDRVAADRGTRRHPVADDAAIAAGAAGAGAMAERHHRKHVAEEERTTGRPAADPAVAEPAAPGAEPVGTQRTAQPEPAVNTSGAAEPVGTQRTAQPEPAADTSAAAEPAAMEQPTAAPVGDTQSAPQTQRAGAYPGHPGERRRRRGGLLGNLLHR